MKEEKHKSTLNLRSIFRYMMENGNYPQYEQGYILFGIDENTGVVEYNEGILSVRLFFTIDEEAYDIFSEASNSTMAETYIVKTIILEDLRTIMFSCEFMCDGLRDLRRFFPRAVNRLKESLEVHKAEMKKAIISDSLTSGAIATGDSFVPGSKANKLLS